jgi:hypothetical protein
VRARPGRVRSAPARARILAIAVLAIGFVGGVRSHAAVAIAASTGMSSAGASAASGSAPKASDTSAEQGSSPGLEAAAPTTPTTPEVALAAKDFERGAALLASKKGAKRLAPADAAFTAAVDRLAPAEETLDPEGRRILARALDARAQTRLLRGRPKDADTDFDRLVTFDPAYEPDAAKTSRKALDRFRKIRAPRVGFVTLKVDPPEAAIVWNGRDLGPASALSRERAVLAGPYTVHARRDCYEEKEATGDIAAGEKKDLVLTLDAFARVVRFETSPSGFDVDIDGTFMGKTAAPELPAPDRAGEDDAEDAAIELSPEDRAGEDAPPGVGAAPANGALELACLAAGDHVYTVRKDCYADVRGTVTVEIDLLDRTPIVVPVITPRKRETRLSVSTDTPGAVLFLDGAPAGALPIRDRLLCAPRISMEARVKDRVIWSQTRELEDGPLEIRARRRPTLTLVMAEEGSDAADAALAEKIRGRFAALASFNLDDRPPGRVGTVAMPDSGTGGSPGSGRQPDLKLQVGPGDMGAGEPSLRLELIPQAHPQLKTAAACFQEDSACVDRFFDELDAAWTPGGEPSGRVDAIPDTRNGAHVPAGITPPGSLTIPLPRALAATLLDAVVLPPGAERSTSLMTLASALIGAGAYREALDQALERTDWPHVPGPASRGTAAFLAGICHQALGEQEAARAAFRRAATDPTATLWTADGIPVAPLARLMLPPGNP